MTRNDLTNSNKDLERNEQLRSPQRYLRPAVDIFESEDTLTLMADLPGVDKPDLDIQFEQGLLTIKAAVAAPEHERATLLNEFTPASYYRQFRLSDDYDAETANAELTHGVLTLTVAKREAVKPRRITIH